MKDDHNPVLEEIDRQSSGHFAQLRESYRAVGDRTWLTADFDQFNLESSRSLYTAESLHVRNPRPRELEVYALLSGLPFAEEFTDRLTAVQMRISEILGDSMHYWVARQNLGVEYCVFKWPTDSWDEQRCGLVKNVLQSIPKKSFRFYIGGVQINPDGCVVARGFDERAEIFRIRELIRAGIPFLPNKQSGWAHVPLGRILEPLGVEVFERLSSLVRELSDQLIASTEITVMKFVHESRWYMEDREILADYALAGAVRHEGKQ